MVQFIPMVWIENLQLKEWITENILMLFTRCNHYDKFRLKEQHLHKNCMRNGGLQRVNWCIHVQCLVTTTSTQTYLSLGPVLVHRAQHKSTPWSDVKRLYSTFAIVSAQGTYLGPWIAPSQGESHSKEKMAIFKFCKTLQIAKCRLENKGTLDFQKIKNKN